MGVDQPMKIVAIADFSGHGEGMVGLSDICQHLIQFDSPAPGNRDGLAALHEQFGGHRAHTAPPPVTIADFLTSDIVILLRYSEPNG